MQRCSYPLSWGLWAMGSVSEYGRMPPEANRAKTSFTLVGHSADFTRVGRSCDLCWWRGPQSAGEVKRWKRPIIHHHYLFIRKQYLIHNFFIISEALCDPSGVSVTCCALPPGDRPSTIHPRSSSERRLRLRLPLSADIAFTRSSWLLTIIPLVRW